MRNNLITLKLSGNKATIVALEFAKYTNNDTIAMQANEVDGQPFAMCTVNWEANWEGVYPYKETFKFPAVVIKDYSENEGIADELIRAGVITKGAYMANTGGGVVVGMLTEKWQEIASEQLMKLYPKESGGEFFDLSKLSEEEFKQMHNKNFTDKYKKDDE